MPRETIRNRRGDLTIYALDKSYQEQSIRTSVDMTVRSVTLGRDWSSLEAAKQGFLVEYEERGPCVKRGRTIVPSGHKVYTERWKFNRLDDARAKFKEMTK